MSSMETKKRAPESTALALVVLVLMVSSGPALAWNLAPCSADASAKRATVGKELRAAKPGSLKYLPFPFPHRLEEVVADYKHQVLSRWGGIPREKLRPGQQALLDELRGGTLKIGMVTVENWGIRRCTDPHSGEQYFLLTIADGSNREIARAALDESGTLEQTGFAGEGERPLPDLTSVGGRVASRLDVKVDSPIYVTSTGSLRCDVLMPCVAVRSRGSVYLVASDGELFEIPAQRRMLSFKNDLGSPEKRNAKLKELEAANEATTSLGGDAFVSVRRHGRLDEE